MAFIEQRRGRKGIYVYYHDKNTGKQRQVPRKLTKHLDKLSPEEVKAWVENWEKEHGVVVDRSRRLNLKEDEKLIQLWTAYQTHMRNTRKRGDSTEQGEDTVFYNHIVEFFVGQKERKDPLTWHDLVPEFHTHLYSKKMSDSTIRSILWALNRFGKYLVWMRLMAFPFVIQTPSRENRKITPLKVGISPDDVLKFVDDFKLSAKTELGKSPRGGPLAKITPEQIKLAVLIGFFGSLRPHEAWALEKGDFLTGASAEKFSKTYEGFKKFGLGSRLAIIVNKSWQKKKKQPHKIESLMKTHYSFGVVNIWNPDAAKRIALLLKSMPDGRIFTLGYHSMFHVWDREIQPKLKVTAHDLRRASGLFLGRTIRVDLTLLQEHLRHAEIETTMLYTRDPNVPEIKGKSKLQDFDDVI